MKTSTCIASTVLFAMPVTCLAGSDLVLNEWNCVRDDSWLNNTDTCNTATCATDQDTYFGRVMGNGGDWMEFVVTRDHADIRGWAVQWAAVTGSTSTPLPTTSGTDIWYGNGSLPQGQVVFANVAAWSDLRAGTIITITRDGTAQGGLDTDLSFDPCAGDWWMNVNLTSTSLVTATWNVTNVNTNKIYISHQDWRARILKADGSLAIDLVGESLPSWSGSGISKYEVGKLQDTPSQATTPYSNYQDSNNSSFGAPNRWKSANAADFGCTVRQDLSALRTAVRNELCGSCVPLLLNEYNAVSSTSFLGGGTQAQDANVPPGQASDAFFGRVMGNGGNWFEVVIATDHVDMRNWSLDWTESGSSGSIKLSDNAFWQDMRIGTIVTFIEKTTAQGGLSTDLSYNGTTDTWVNINTFDTAMVASTTSTKAGAVSGSFTTSNDRWTLSARNASGTRVMGPSGEGSVAYNGGSVNGEDVCRLHEDPTGKTDPTSPYDDDGSRSTFGRPNSWTACPSGSTVTQSFATLLASGCVATVFDPADFNRDGHVDGADLGILLGGWAQGGVTDLNHDGTTNGADLGLLLGAWR